MKPLILSFIILSAGLLQTRAQTSPPLLDSIVYFNFNASTGDSSSIDKVHYLYDQENREIFRGYSRWISRLKIWDYQEYTQRIFDQKNQLIEKIEHGLPGLQFPYVREQWEYDAVGKPVTQYRYWKMYEKDAWILNGKQDIKTNESGQLIQKIEYLWLKAENDWIPDASYSHYYDQNGRDTLLVVVYFNRQTMKWMDGQRTKTTYNGLGLKTSEVTLWRNPDGIWETYYSYRCDYDSLGRKTWERYPVEGGIWYSEFAYDSVGNSTTLYSGRFFPDTAFSIRGRTERKFDQEGRMTDYENYYLHEGEWIPNQKTHWLYSESGRILEQTEWSRDQGSGEWILYFQMRYHFNEFDQCRMSESYLWNTDLMDWALSGRGHYYFRNNGTGIPGISIETIRAFPNPTKDVVYFPDLSPGTMLYLYNSTGMLISQEQISNERVDLSQRPAGIYYLVIQDKNGKVMTSQILKN